MTALFQSDFGLLLLLSVAVPAARRGRTVVPGVARHQRMDIGTSVADLIRIAHRKLAELDGSPLNAARHAHMRAPSGALTRQRLAIGLLAPDVQKALLQGTVAGIPEAEQLLSGDVPLDWNEQRRMLAMIA